MNVLEKNVIEMKRLADMLVSRTFPRVDFGTEQDILLLKQRILVVDGYEVLVCYSKADYGDYFLESLQIQAIYAPFIPFCVICKIGRAFLGSDNLSYIEFFKYNKKVYCWTLRSRDGYILPPDKKSKQSNYEGFAFSILQPGAVDLF